MAYSALVSLTQTTDLILNPHRYTVSVDAAETIKSIRGRHALSLISLLDAFPTNSNISEAKTRDAAAEAEDILEHFMWKQLDDPSCASDEFELNLKRMSQEIASITGDSPPSAADVSHLLSLKQTTAPKGKNDTVIGLDEELTAIKLKLCGESSKLEVIPILGMGGIGKTTLARFAYDDRLTVEHFDVRCWITISQDYSVQGILSCLRDSMKSYDEQMDAHKDEATMRERVYKCLKGRRYLIVMDDVWSTKALDDVRNMFPNDHNGSKDGSRISTSPGLIININI